MRFLAFLLGVTVCLLIFGIPLWVSFLAMLAICLDVEVDTASSLAVYLTIAWVVSLGIKVCFIDE